MNLHNSLDIDEAQPNCLFLPVSLRLTALVWCFLRVWPPSSLVLFTWYSGRRCLRVWEPPCLWGVCVDTWSMTWSTTTCTTARHGRTPTCTGWKRTTSNTTLNIKEQVRTWDLRCQTLEHLSTPVVLKPVLEYPQPCTFCMSPSSVTSIITHQLISGDCKTWSGCQI